MNETTSDERRRQLRRRMDRDVGTVALQQFDYRGSPYLRPNQKWVCGWAADGAPCQIGPDKGGRCVATYECRPFKKGDLWQCTRSEPGGGKCDTGPLPDGTCCRPVPKCRPVLSWRARRGVTARWIFVVIIGALLGLGGSTVGSDFLSPGEVTFQHSGIEQCGDCHSAFAAGPTTWLGAAFSESTAAEDSKLCLSCHNLGVDGTNPHSLPPGHLDTLKEQVEQASAPGQPVSLRLASLALDEPHNANGPLSCMTCHQEHRGNKFDLAAISNQRCMACHTVKFDSLSRGHPDFTTYPYRRRTRLVFNHVTHTGKHFPDPEYRDRAPRECKNCHMPEADGRMMVVKSFDGVCAACHAGQIDGTDRQTSKGLAILAVPGLDVETLRERGAPIGEWPEDADADITAFMDFLLAGDPGYVDAKSVLEGIKLYDLSEATDRQIRAVETVAWRIKEMLRDLKAEGVHGLMTRMENATGKTSDAAELAGLFGFLPADGVRMAQHDWFPNLMRDVALHQSGVAVPMPGTGEVEAPADDGETEPPDVTGDEESDILEDDEDADILDDDDADLSDDDDIMADDDDDDIFGDDDDIMADDDDDDIFGDDSDLDDSEEAESEESEPEIEAADEMPDEDWSSAGGWYREDFTLRYRPMGHGDRFLQAWLDLTARTGDRPGSNSARKIFNLLAKSDAPGTCGKCHSVDTLTEGGFVVNWRSKHSAPNQREFNTFSHTAHFALLDEKGCATCHRLDPDADYAAGFKDTDPRTFESNFIRLDRDICATCHTAAEAGDNCLICHNYHIGTFAPVVASTPTMTKTKE